jgi:hypothetical protein
MILLRLIGVLLLVVLNGFFAAAEFSLVAVRISRVRQLVVKGSPRAKIVELLLGDLHRVSAYNSASPPARPWALGELTLAQLVQPVKRTHGGVRMLLLITASPSRLRSFSSAPFTLSWVNCTQTISLPVPNVLH